MFRWHDNVDFGGNEVLKVLFFTVSGYYNEPVRKERHQSWSVQTSCGGLVHEAVRRPQNKVARCRYCRINKFTTKSGWVVFTRMECSICRVPLCIGNKSDRNCFQMYHQELGHHLENRSLYSLPPDIP